VQAKDGREVWVSTNGIPLLNADGTLRGYRGSDNDITERKRAQRYQSLSAEILSALNEPLSVRDVINRILAAIQQETGFDAVGIRLRSGDDFPYFVQNGFSPEFLLTENTLIARDENGGLCRDANGNIRLECTCGLVLSGKADPANPLFTKDGSWWTNNSLLLLDLPANQDSRLHPRNRCMHQGYCSLALIPIRANRDIVGLLQLNDRKKDRFTLDQIHFFEGISASIGVALMRKQQEDALRESEARHRLLFDGSWDAMMTIGPPSWKFTAGNPAACKMFGAKDAAEFTALGPWDVSPERQPDGSLSVDKAREATEAALREGSLFFEWTHRRGFPRHRAADQDRDGRAGISPGHRARHHRPEAGRRAHREDAPAAAEHQPASEVAPGPGPAGGQTPEGYRRYRPLVRRRFLSHLVDPARRSV
jgi:PAS domain-containing protein